MFKFLKELLVELLVDEVTTEQDGAERLWQRRYNELLKYHSHTEALRVLKEEANAKKR